MCLSARVGSLLSVSCNLQGHCDQEEMMSTTVDKLLPSCSAFLSFTHSLLLNSFENKHLFLFFFLTDQIVDLYTFRFFKWCQVNLFPRLSGCRFGVGWCLKLQLNHNSTTFCFLLIDLDKEGITNNNT